MHCLTGFKMVLFIYKHNSLSDIECWKFVYSSFYQRDICLISGSEELFDETDQFVSYISYHLLSLYDLRYYA